MENREHARLETYNGEPVMLEGLRAEGDLKGLMLEMKVEQRFRNLTGNNIEVVYTFPLPWGAVLLGVEVQLGGKRLSGAVVEKKQAEAEYEAALSQGDAAIMLERNRDQSYSLNLGNLNAGETCIVMLRYGQLLQFEQGGLRVMIPTVIAPRYGDAVQDGGLQPHQTFGHDLLVEYPFDIVLRLHGDLARARVASPSHPAGVAVANDVLTVSLARQGALDRDFVLVVDGLAQDSIALIAQDAVLADHVVALASFCPRMSAESFRPVAVKLLVDCSGSMAGDSIEAAKRALQAIVAGMQQGDRFSLSRFGSHVEHRSRGLWQVTDATRVAAQRWVGALEADLGGTEMEAALQSTFALAHAVPSDVLLVTDGEIDAIEPAIAAAKASGQRVFVVGIGSSPAEAHLRRLSEATGGACAFVAPGEAVERAVLRMFACLRSPHLNNMSVAWPAGSEVLWASALPASIFEGDTISVFALLRQTPAGEVRLLGERAPGALAEEIGRAAFSAAMETGDALSRIAATKRIHAAEPDWLTGHAQDTVQMAVAYQLVTEHTNFLLLHARAEDEKPVDMPDLHQVRHMLPAGWGGVGSVAGSARGMFFETRVVDYNPSGSLDWGDDLPAMLRVSSRAAPYGSSPDLLDIPAFLRKASDSSSGPVRFSRRPSSDLNQRLDGKELTPMELSAWLIATPPEAWPSTYAGLNEIGVSAAVVDWLELIIGAETDEQTVVAAFLYAMVQRASIGGPDDASLSRKVKGFIQSWRGRSEAAPILPPSVDLALVEKILADLEGTSATAWGDGIYALAVT